MPSSAISATSRLTSFRGSLAQRLVTGLVGTLVLAIASHVAFPLSFTPVPFTLQPLAVLAVGLLLGPVDGTLALIAYLAEGAMGLPVFSPTGPGGLLQLFGPTGGFLLADPLVALIAGYGVRKLAGSAETYWAAVLACITATAVLFASGAAWLVYLHPMAPHALWMAAVAPFLPGELVKIFVAAGMYRTFHSSLGR